MTNYNYAQSCWDYILPDGSAFCHWGGKDISHRILRELNLREGDRLCDICCGEAGTLSLINGPAIEVYGVDISKSALEKALMLCKRKKQEFHFVQTDVRTMPFSNNFFTTLFAQDPDVFLHPDKIAVLKEISRVSKKGAVFVLQTYCETSSITAKEKEKTDKIFRKLGYPYTKLINKDKLPRMLKMAGFTLRVMQDMHDIYARDNYEMIERLKQYWPQIQKSDGKQGYYLKELLEWERYLFSKRAWTGVIAKAVKK